MASKNIDENEAEKEEPVVSAKAQKASEELTNGVLLDQLEELEQQKTKLLLNLKEYKEKYEQQKSDQTDIYYYLNKKLDENYETIALLEEQILNEQTQREIHEKKLEKRIEDLNLKLSQDETKYQSKLKEAEEKLHKLKEFSENKEELEKNFEKLLETLEAERKHYGELMDENERKSIRERERFRKECELQFDEYKHKLQDEADDKLSSKTKKTLKTNTNIKMELTYQSKQADQVLLYNKKVLDKDRELRQELELTQTTQKEMVKRLALYQRLIKQLNEKVNIQESNMLADMEAASNNLKEKDNVIESLQRQLKSAQQKPSSNRKNNQDFFDFLSSKYKELVDMHCSNNKDTSKAFVKKNGDMVMNELVAYAVQHFPERFSHILSERSAGGLFPPLSTGDCSGAARGQPNSKHLVTGISAWDSARSSSIKHNWWGAYKKEDSEGRDQESATSQAGIQTDGRIQHYPVGSKWIKAGDVGSANANCNDGFFINHEERHIKNNLSQPVDHHSAFKIDVSSSVSSSKESLQSLSKSDIFSPMSDPLHRKNKQKKNDFTSVSASGSVSSRFRK